MDIKRKVDGAIVRDVTHSMSLSDGRKWKKELPDCITYYKVEHWEPVEEWVDIQVKKCAMGDLPYLKNVEWRYPQ